MMSLNMGRDYHPMFSVMCARGDSSSDQTLVRDDTLVTQALGWGERGNTVCQ